MLFSNLSKVYILPKRKILISFQILLGIELSMLKIERLWVQEFCVPQP
jgi:hypothetical protein